MLLDRLRSATREHHRKLEGELDLLSPGLTLERYREVLARFDGFLRPFECPVRPALDAVDPRLMLDRSKVAHLRKDLEALDVNPSGVPLCRDLPACRELPEALG